MLENTTALSPIINQIVNFFFVKIFLQPSFVVHMYKNANKIIVIPNSYIKYIGFTTQHKSLKINNSNNAS